MSSNITDKHKKIICMRSGNRCAMPDCRIELIVDETRNDDPSIIGILAHIKGERPGTARYDESMTDEERNSYRNRIFVCSNCHKKIDDQRNSYSAKNLYRIKREHEQWIRESTRSEVVDVTFAELNVVMSYLASGKYEPSESLEIVPPRDKIKKNNLSGGNEALITMGMAQVNQVADYINKSPDVEFGERLKQGFVKEYDRLRKHEGLEGNGLFDALQYFAWGGSNDFRRRAAGLTVLVYLFEKCEVFEK